MGFPNKVLPRTTKQEAMPQFCRIQDAQSVVHSRAARKIDFVYDRNDVQKRNHSSAAWTTTYVAMPTTAMRDTAPAKWPAAGFTSEHSGARFHVRTEPAAVYRRFVREVYNLSNATQ